MRVATEEPDALLTCPHCGLEMLASEAIRFRRSHRALRWIWMAIGLLAVLGLVALAYRYRTPIGIAYDVLLEESGSNLAAFGLLGVSLILALCCLSWLAFPILVLIGLRGLKRRTQEVEETTRVCARHLARLTAVQKPIQNAYGPASNAPPARADEITPMTK